MVLSRGGVGAPCLLVVCWGPAVLGHLVQQVLPAYANGSWAANNASGGPGAAPAHGGIHVANWRWNEIGLLFAISLFVVVIGLAKVGFHHAHWLSSRVPESCLMILMGVIVGGIIYGYGVPVPSNEEDKIVPQTDVHEFAILTFTPRLFFLVLLPPVILESAYSLYDRAFAFNFHTILLYAVIGTLINTFLIGAALFGLSEASMLGAMTVMEDGVLYRVTLTDCLVFSALISAVDPVAVLAIFQEVGINKDLYYLVFGESLLNDAVTVVLYTTMVTFSEMSEVPSQEYGLACVAFFTVSLGGCVVGTGAGLVSALITRTTEDIRVVEPLAVLGVAYLSYLTAELFHFSGIISIIFCGIVQAHYALKNISQKSYVTVKYFTRMVSSTCDAIIFLFLGMVLVNDNHVWHTGFVLWALILCFICRFIGVFSLTALANLYRVKPISGKEQFIMAYGGLRGAVAFSLAEMLQEDIVRPRSVFVTTTLVVILFTVFLQGSTIKMLVNQLHISKSKTGKKSLNEELADHVLSMLMSAVEEIAGIRTDFYVRRKFEQLDDSFLKRVFLKPGRQSDLTVLFEKLSMTEHFTHLYGPLALAEHSGKCSYQSAGSALVPPTTAGGSSSSGEQMYRSHSCRTTARFSLLYPDCYLPPKYMAMRGEAEPVEALRHALHSNPYEKSQVHFDPEEAVSKGLGVEQLLQLRHLKTLQMAELVAARRDHDEALYLPGDASELTPTREMVRSELSEEEDVPVELQQGIQAILDKAEHRLSRTVSMASSDCHSAWWSLPEPQAAPPQSHGGSRGAHASSESSL